MVLNTTFKKKTKELSFLYLFAKLWRMSYIFVDVADCDVSNNPDPEDLEESSFV